MAEFLPRTRPSRPRDTSDFVKQDNRFANRPKLAATLAPIMKAKTSAEWLAQFEEHHVPAGPIYRMDEVFADPQVQHLGMAEKVQHRSAARSSSWDSR